MEKYLMSYKEFNRLVNEANNRWIQELEEDEFNRSTLSYEEYRKYLMKWFETMEDNILNHWEMFNKRHSKLPTHLLIDNDSVYKRFGNQKFIIIKNCYDDCFSFFNNEKELDILAMTISDNPQLCLSDPIIKLKEEDIEAIRQFVIKYKEKLGEFADGNGIFLEWYPKNFNYK